MAQRILVVEDSPDISRLLVHILGAAGYEVTVEEEGQAGWETFQRLKPDLLLLDVNLPGMSGLELCRRVRQVARTPIIMLTVQAEIEAVREGLDAGANAYLSKPFEIAHLRAAVEYALRPRIRRLPAQKRGEVGAQDPDH